MRITLFLFISILLNQEIAKCQPTGNEKLYLDIRDEIGGEEILIGRSIPEDDFKGKNKIKASFKDKNYVVIDQSISGAIGFERYPNDSLPHKTLMTDDHQLCIIRNQQDTMTIWLRNVRGFCYLKISFLPGKFILRVDDAGNTLKPYELLPKIEVNGNSYVDNLTPKNWENYRYTSQANQQRSFNLLEEYKTISPTNKHFKGVSGNGRYKSELWIEANNITMVLYDTLHNLADYYYAGKIYQENDSVYNVKFESLMIWSSRNVVQLWNTAPHDPLERLQGPGPTGFITDTVSAKFLAQICFSSITDSCVCFLAKEVLTEVNNPQVTYNFEQNGKVYNYIQVTFNWFGREFLTRIQNYNPEFANMLYYSDLTSNVYGSTTSFIMTDSTIQRTPSSWWITPGFTDLKMHLVE